MSLKDNFNQAVKELLKRDGLVGNESSKKSPPPLKSELDRFLEPDQEPSSPYSSSEAFNGSAGGEAASAAQTNGGQPTGGANPETAAGGFSPAAGGVSYAYGTGGTVPPAPPLPPSDNVPSLPDAPYFETEETTIISRNTIVDGNIRSFANINIEGSVKGDVQITKNATLSGKIEGNLACTNAAMVGSSMQGNVTSKGEVVMDRDSVLIGNIGAQQLDLNGKIRGNLDVAGLADLKSDSVIMGDITASTIKVDKGANIKGFMNVTFAQDNLADVFPDQITVGD